MDGFLPWLGGKSLLAQPIAQRIGRIGHSCYVEPFMGAAHVFFAREPVHVEILNDVNRDLVTLFRVLQNHLDEFFRCFRWAVTSRDEWERLNRLPGDALTDIQRAARFYYLQKGAFGGKVAGRNFGTGTTGGPRLNLLRLGEDLSAVHLRLARVTIENLPWSDCLARYDRPHTLFYLDPPYWGHEDDYGKGIFGREDYERLAAQLGALKGQFLLSLNDTPEVRRIFAGFPREVLSTRYTASRKASGRGKVRELLIRSRPTS